MIQSMDVNVPRWSDLTTVQRRRLAVLIGRLALRRLPSSIPAQGSEGGTADETGSDPPERGAVHGKIVARHLDRQAVVYVRQSTPQQLEHHRESTSLQYSVVEHACQLGWARLRVAVMDDDLGRSGASAEGRPGFQRFVAEVGLGPVGLVLGYEVSRLARSCCDRSRIPVIVITQSVRRKSFSPSNVIMRRIAASS